MVTFALVVRSCLHLATAVVAMFLNQFLVREWHEPLLIAAMLQLAIAMYTAINECICPRVFRVNQDLVHARELLRLTNAEFALAALVNAASTAFLILALQYINLTFVQLILLILPFVVGWTMHLWTARKQAWALLVSAVSAIGLFVAVWQTRLWEFGDRSLGLLFATCCAASQLAHSGVLHHLADKYPEFVHRFDIHTALFDRVAGTSAVLLLSTAVVEVLLTGLVVPSTQFLTMLALSMCVAVVRDTTLLAVPMTDDQYGALAMTRSAVVILAGAFLSQMELSTDVRVTVIVLTVVTAVLAFSLQHGTCCRADAAAVTHVHLEDAAVADGESAERIHLNNQHFVIEAEPVKASP